jgi:hypothetical protein
MVSDRDERLILQAGSELQEFVKMFAKKYAKLFKSGCYAERIFPSIQRPFFPFEVFIEIKEKKS